MELNKTSAALNVAMAAAREAGNQIIQAITQIDRVKVTQKDRHELVSETDVLVEQIIIEELDKAYPEFNILGEESGLVDRNSEFTWIIDPIDGTHNFLHSHPHCGISIALKHNDDIVAAVIYDAIRNELFSARKGAGAQLDGRRIRVSNVSKLADSLLVTGYPSRHTEDTKPWLKSFALVLPRAQTIHNTGSSVLDLAYVACGRYDGLWQYGLKQWDIAAGSLLIKEAGGLISDISGNVDVFKTGNLIAGNPKVFEKLSVLVTHNHK